MTDHGPAGSSGSRREKAADKKLTAIAEARLNFRAAS